MAVIVLGTEEISQEVKAKIREAHQDEHHFKFHLFRAAPSIFVLKGFSIIYLDEPYVHKF